MHKWSSLAFGARTYYRPIEAAIRWAGLLRLEPRILETLGKRPLPEPDDFPRWPRLRLYTDRILDGMAHGELAHGKAGIVREGVHLELNDPALTIRHVDLKSWVAHYYPGEKPSFLFDEMERALHPALNPHSLSVLLAEREAAKVELAELRQAHENLRAAHEVLAKDHAARVAESDNAREPGSRAESTYLNVIGGLLSLLLGKSPGGKPYSSFTSQEAVINALVAHHGDQLGISKSTLENKFAQARRRLQSR